jgi:hypothetical protein
MRKFLILNTIIYQAFFSNCLAENPFIFRRHFEGMANTGFENDFAKDQNISAAFYEAEFGGVISYTPCYEEGLALTVGYEGTYLDWENQPDFNQSNYNNITLALYAFSARLGDWTWKSMVKARESIDNNNLDYFLTWDLLLWGRHEYVNPCLPLPLGLHFGIFAETGMKANRIYPVIGVDFNPSDRLSVNVVFPMDMSIVYQKTEVLEIAAAVRFFARRQRVGLDEPVPYAMWEWRGWGGEVGLNYYGFLNSRINMHVGSTFGGKIRVSNRNRNHPVHYNPEGSLYAGAEFNFPI